MRFTTPAVTLLSIVLTATEAASCGGGGSPRRPSTPPPPVASIQTLAGTLFVVAEGCVPDLETMTREVNGVVERAQRVGAAGSLDGWTLHARSPEATRERCAGSHGDACIDVGSRTMHVWCPGSEHGAPGTEHEVSHALAYVAGLGCWREVGHGVNFRCERKR